MLQFLPCLSVPPYLPPPPSLYMIAVRMNWLNIDLSFQCRVYVKFYVTNLYHFKILQQSVFVNQGKYLAYLG